MYNFEEKQKEIRKQAKELGVNVEQNLTNHHLIVCSVYDGNGVRFQDETVQSFVNRLLREYNNHVDLGY